MKRSWLLHLFVTLSIGLLSSGLANAVTMVSINACIDCHGTTVNTNVPSPDGTARNTPARSFLGSHSTHVPARVTTCAGCHVQPTLMDHRDGKINMAASMTGGVVYSAAVANVVPQDNQLTTTGMGTCMGTSAGCHVGSASGVWGSVSTCRTCHGYPPVTTGADPDNKHVAGATAVNHIGTGATVNTKATFDSVHGGCQICHGTKSTTNGDGNTHSAHANYVVATQHNTGNINMNGPVGTGVGYNTLNRGCDAACHGNDASHRMTTSAKTLTFGNYGVASSTCVGCHASAQGTRAGVMGEFGLAWGHKKSGRGAVTDADCIVCHLEGVYATQARSATYHLGVAGGNIDLRDPDGAGETPITNMSNAAWTFKRYSTSFASGSRTSTGATANTVDNIITQKFCVKCHDANGAANTTARSNNGGTGTANMPFGGINLGANYTTANGAVAAGGLINVATQFATTNSSVHPVLGARSKDFPTAARMNNPYKPTGTRGTAGTLSAGVVIGCNDCHRANNTTTRRMITAHGNAVTITGRMTTTGASFTPGTNDVTFCGQCHTGYTAALTHHDVGSALSAATNNGMMTYLQYACNVCHSSGYNTAVVRPIRGLDIHGVNVLPSTGLTKEAGSRWAGSSVGSPAIVNAKPYAFIRNTEILTTHSPAKIGTTVYSANCTMGNSTPNCSRANQVYTVGGSY